MQVGPRCQGMYDSYTAPLTPSAFSRPKVTKQLYYMLGKLQCFSCHPFLMKQRMHLPFPRHVCNVILIVVSCSFFQNEQAIKYGLEGHFIND